MNAPQPKVARIKLMAAIAFGGVTLFGFQNCGQVPSISLSTASHSLAVAGNLRVTEGQTTHLTVPFTEPFPAGSVVHWAISKGPIGNNEDWDSRSGDYTFVQSSTDFILPALPLIDGVYEGVEPVILTFTMDDGSLFPPVTIEITDADPVPTLQSVSVPIDAGDPAVIPITLTVPSLTDTIVNWSTEDGTAVAGTQYTAASGQITIPAGQTAASVTVLTALQDNFVSQTAFSVNIVGTGLISPQPATATVLLNASNPLELPPILSVAPESTTLPDGQAQIFNVSLSHPTTVDVPFFWNVSSGSATIGADLPAQNASGVIPAGTTSVQVSVTTTADNFFELNPTRSFNFDITNVQNCLNLSAHALGTIVDHVTAPTLSITDDKPVYSRGDTATVTFTLSAPVDGTVSVAWSTADGTGQAGVEYTASSGTLTFARGVQTQTATVQWLDYTNPGSYTFTINATATISPP